MRPVIRTRFGRSVSGDVDDELAFHIDMRARQLIASGVPSEIAHDEARRRFGDIGEVRNSCITYDHERLRSMNRLTLLHDLVQDLAYAFRMLRRTPTVSLVVILTLALGIGANTAIFSLVNAVLLRRLPVRAPDELVVLGDPARVGGMGFDSNPRTDLFSFPTYQRLVAETSLVTGLAATGITQRLELKVDGSQGTGETPRGRMVTGNYFSVLGVPAFIGRTLNAGEDDERGGAPVVVISHGYWQRRFAADSSVVGRDVLINNARFTVVGVAAPSFTGEIVGVRTDLWIPLGMHHMLFPNVPVLDDAHAYWLQLIGRMRPGVTLDQVREGFTPVVRRTLADQAGIPELVARAQTADVPISSGARGLSRVRNTYRAPLLILMVGVGLLLLIICANVGNILMARAVARWREMSVRLAIGAGRGRLVRQLLTESLLLGLVGAGAGLVLSNWMTRYLLLMAADGGPVLPVNAGFGAAALVFTSLTGLSAVVLFGLLPALRTSRVELATAIRASSKATTGSGMGHRNPAGRLLIAAQVALSLVLVVGASLLVRSLHHLQTSDAGLDRNRLLIVDIDAESRAYEDTKLLGLAREVHAAVARVPGVQAVSYNENGLFLGTESVTNLAVPGFEVRQRSDSASYYDQVGPGFVKATGGRLLYGRDFTASDIDGSTSVLIVNESFSRFYFGNVSPIGRSIRLGTSTYAQIAGVIADQKDHALVGPARRRFYLAYQQQLLGSPSLLRLVVRTSGDPATLAPAVRKAILDVDADLPIRDASPLSRLIRDSISEERLMARLATVFGSAALLLAAIGLYGVMSYAVNRRSGEIGLRVALGAQRGTVLRMVLRDAMMLVGLGIVLGIPLTLGASRIIRSQLHGVEPTDPLAFGIALAVLGFGAIAAALLPALRASRVAPVVALRAE